MDCSNRISYESIQPITRYTHFSRLWRPLVAEYVKAEQHSLNLESEHKHQVWLQIPKPVVIYNHSFMAELEDKRSKKFQCDWPKGFWRAAENGTFRKFRKSCKISHFRSRRPREQRCRCTEGLTRWKNFHSKTSHCRNLNLIVATPPWGQRVSFNGPEQWKEFATHLPILVTFGPVVFAALAKNKGKKEKNNSKE